MANHTDHNKISKETETLKDDKHAHLIENNLINTIKNGFTNTISNNVDMKQITNSSSANETTNTQQTVLNQTSTIESTVNNQTNPFDITMDVANITAVIVNKTDIAIISLVPKVYSISLYCSTL